MPLSNNEQLLWYLFWLFSVVTDALPNIIICNFNWKLCFLFMFITNANIISIICKCKTTEVKLPNKQKVALFVTNVSSNGKILFESPFLSMCCLMLTIFFHLQPEVFNSGVRKSETAYPYATSMIWHLFKKFADFCEWPPWCFQWTPEDYSSRTKHDDSFIAANCFNSSVLVWQIQTFNI